MLMMMQGGNQRSQIKHSASEAVGSEILSHEACGHYPYRDICRACVGGAWRSDAHKRRQKDQHAIPVASMTTDSSQMDRKEL